MRDFKEIALDITDMLQSNNIFIDWIEADVNDCTAELRIQLSGDWKHEHLRCRRLVENYCSENGIVVNTYNQKSEPSDEDCYEATHTFIVEQIR